MYLLDANVLIEAENLLQRGHCPDFLGVVNRTEPTQKLGFDSGGLSGN